MRGDHVAAAQIKGFARAQTAALGQGFFKALGAVATTQPIGQHPPLRRVVRLHLRQQGRWACPCVSVRSRRVGGEKSELGGWRVHREGGHHVQARDLQRAQALAQRGL